LAYSSSVPVIDRIILHLARRLKLVSASYRKLDNARFDRASRAFPPKIGVNMHCHGISLRISRQLLQWCNTLDANLIRPNRHRLYFESRKLKIICLGVGV
jgi:hypothetical protein